MQQDVAGSHRAKAGLHNALHPDWKHLALCCVSTLHDTQPPFTSVTPAGLMTIWVQLS